MIDFDELTEEEKALNEAALKYMKRYNSVVYGEVNTVFPGWRERYEMENR